MIKIQIKTLFGKLLFEYSSENNTAKKTVQKAVKEGAYLAGADLAGAYLAGAYLAGAYLAGADLTGADLKGADLTGANLEGADLEGADLTGADLTGAYLTGAYLTGAYLTGADLTGAYLAVPVIENIHQKVYQAAKQEGALEMGDWHDKGFCGTTHCQAGWVNHLAGDAGKKLEEETSPAIAAYLIYRKSDPSAYALNFYASNEVALRNMKKLSDMEAARQ